MGSIPAWAGEPKSVGQFPSFKTVYPRVGGGTFSRALFFSLFMGLSPRGRGNPGSRMLRETLSRSIPAWAGEPWRDNRAAGKAAVYPRVGGGTGARQSTGAAEGSIPAWAGEPMSMNPEACHPLPRVYPRVGGGTLPRSLSMGIRYGLSPRGRGNPSPVEAWAIRVKGLSPRGRGNLYSGNIAGPSLSGNPTGPVCQPSGFQFNGT